MSELILCFFNNDRLQKYQFNGNINHNHKIKEVNYEEQM